MFIGIIIPITILACSYWLLCSLLGAVANQYNVKINYTRKIGHFSMFIFPGIIYILFDVTSSIDKLIIAAASSIIFFISLSENFRKKVNYLMLSFIAIDRPEDRPHTLIWIFSQTFVGFFVLTAFALLWNYLHIPYELMYITILTTTIGDGLAEPIGVRFGTHKYSVKGFLIDKLFYRSYEGSITLYVIAFSLTLIFSDNFNQLGKILMILLYPIIMTLTEARSPHTWDTPFLFFIGNLFVTVAYLL